MIVQGIDPVQTILVQVRRGHSVAVGAPEGQ